MKLNLFNNRDYDHSFYRAKDESLSLCVSGVQRAFPGTPATGGIMVDIRVRNPKEKGFKTVRVKGDHLWVSGKCIDVWHTQIGDFRASNSIPELCWVRINPLAQLELPLS